MKNAIAACPFCGEDEGNDRPMIVTALSDGAHWYHVECRRCRAKTGQFGRDALAIERWNMRTPPKSTWGEKK